MEIFSLYCFLALENCGKFFDAAEDMHISQSSFSKHIQSLEKELDVKLFVRNQKGAVLTEAGKVFLPYAKNIVREYGKSNVLISEYKSRYAKRLRVYTHSYQVAYGVTELLDEFAKENLDIDLETVELESGVALKHVKNDRQTAAIVLSGSECDDDDFTCCTVQEDPITAIVSVKNRLALYDKIPLKSLVGENIQIISEVQDSTLHKLLLDKCRDAGIEPNVDSYNLWYTTINSVVERYNVVSVQPKRIAHLVPCENIKYIDLLETEPIINKVIVNKKQCFEPAERLIAFAKKYREKINLSDK